MKNQNNIESKVYCKKECEGALQYNSNKNRSEENSRQTLFIQINNVSSSCWLRK